MKENQLQDLIPALQNAKKRAELEKDLRKLGRLIDNRVASFLEIQDYNVLMRRYVELGGSRDRIEKRSRWC